MKALLLILFIALYQIRTEAQRCSSPKVTRKQVFIYRTYPMIRVNVIACLYVDRSEKNNYYDITSNCIQAAKTGKFYDKYGDIQFVKSSSSKVTITYYEATADPLTNTIWLQSGTKCKYDAGFCYDPKEGLIYAVTWEVKPATHEKCPENLKNLYQIFYGFVDYWNFPEDHRSYIFYSVPLTDKAFPLGLSNSSMCHNKKVWYADETGYIVSEKNILPATKSTRVMNQRIFPAFKSKAAASEFILKDCSLRAHSLNFDSEVDLDYLLDLENLKIILNIYQQKIGNNKQLLDDLSNKVAKIPNDIRPSISITEFEAVKQTIETILNTLNALKIKTGTFDKVRSAIFDHVFQITEDIKKLQIKTKNLETRDNSNTFWIKQLTPTIEKKVIDGVLPLLNSVNQSCIDCVNNQEKLKRDFKNALHSLQSELAKVSDSIETTVQQHSQNIERKITDSLDPKINYAIQQSDDCLSKLNDTYNNLYNELNGNYMKQEVTEAQTMTLIKKLEDTFQKFKKTIDHSQGVKSTTDLLHKKFDARFIKLDELSTRVDGVDSKVSTISRDLDNFKQTFTNRVNASDSKIDDLTKTVNQCNTDSKTNEASNNLEFLLIYQNLQTLNKTIDAISSDLNSKMNSVLDPAKIDKIAKDLDAAKMSLHDEIIATNKKISDLENEVKECKLLTKDNSDNQAKIITELYNKINNLLLTNEKLDMHVANINLQLTTVTDKSNSCDDEVKHLKDELKRLRDEFDKNKKEHDKFINDFMSSLNPVV